LESGIKNKFSTDLNLVKRGVQVQMGEVLKNTERAQSNCAEGIELKGRLTGLVDRLLENWKGFLTDKMRLLAGFPTGDVVKSAETGRSFISSFPKRPGMIKLRVINPILNFVSVAIPVLVWTIFSAIVLGVLVAWILLLGELYDLISGFFHVEEVSGSTAMPKK